jgi:hypothetical protein
MSTLRSLRLLGAVESGSVTGTQLETFLADAGRRSELSVLLSSRGQSRRMAGSPLTMAAITSSPIAINVIFQAATSETSAACQAVVKSPIAMSAISNSPTALAAVGANPISWGLFSASTYYETHIRTTLANFAGLNPSVYPTVADLISDPVAMADIATTPYAMSAVVASAPTTTLMAASSAGMALVASNTAAITIVAKQTSIMGIIANSPTAMTEIVSRAGATGIMANNAGAIIAIASSESGWAAYSLSPHFSNYLPAVITNLVGLNPASYPTLSSIIADAAALAKVAANRSAVIALASNSAAMSTLASSPNIGIVLGSAVAMGVIGPNTSAMSSFINASGAWAGLFGSSIAKSYIMSTSALVNTIAANSALITYLTGFSKSAQPVAVPDGVAGTYQVFEGMPAKVLTLSVKEAGIAATFSNYKLSGASMAGSQANANLYVSSQAPQVHVAAYTGITWDFVGAGVTAATQPIVKYYDMS